MINIIAYMKNKAQDGVDVDANISLAVNHLWDSIHKNNANDGIVKRTKKLLATVKRPGYIKKNKSHQAHAEFLQYLCKKGVLESIIKADPNQLSQVITNVRAHISDDEFFTAQGATGKSTDFGNLLKEKIFRYSNYRSSDTFNKVYSIAGFPKSTCVYCNETSVITIEKTDSKGQNKSVKALYDLDHFYSESRYPYLALSFYNHIPCCPTCNSKLKLNLHFTLQTHLHPYLDDFDENYLFTPTFEIQKESNITGVKLTKNLAGKNDKLAEDLYIEQRYKNSLDAYMAESLVTYLHHQQAWFSPSHPHHEIFINTLRAMLVEDKKNILGTSHAKVRRDIAKYFDTQKVFIK